MSDYRNMLEQRAKCRAYKNKENPDGRVSLCGEPVQFDEDGREFFEIPGHRREDLIHRMTGYEFSEVYMVEDPIPAKPSRAATRKGDID